MIITIDTKKILKSARKTEFQVGLLVGGILGCIFTTIFNWR
jgi:hypothetical protein